MPETRTPHTIRIMNPNDGSDVGSVEVTREEDIREAVREARTAFPGWRSTPAAERGAALRRAAQDLLEHMPELAALHSSETGRPEEEARGGIHAGADTLLQYAELAPLHRGRSLIGVNRALDLMRPEPRGVAAIVTPWNDPVAVSMGLIGAALAAGNTVVHKPSERCPHVGIRLGEILSPHFDPGVFTTITGGAQEGKILVAMPGIDLVAHVGSTAAGEQIAQSVAHTGAHLVRENGGNDPLIIDDGVPVTWAAEQTAIGAFTNSGQICTSVERVFVHEAIAEDFLEALTQETRRRNENGEVAPLVDTRMRDEVHAQVEEAVRGGARLLVGGELPDTPGSHYPATVLTDCTPQMRVFTDETFGPVAPIMIVADFEEALTRAIDDEYGLAATVLTPNLAHAHAAIDRLPVGTVKINNVFGGAPGGAAQPRGRSGSGYGYGPELLDEMSTMKVIHLEEIPETR